MAEIVRITTPPAGAEAPKPDTATPAPVVTQTSTGAAVHAADPDTTAAAKPAWEALGFKSAEDLAKSYSELRTKMSKDGTPPKPEETPKPVEQKPAEQKPADDAAKAKEQFETGLVESFGKVAGGADKVGDVVTWANQNLAPEEAAAYNAALDTGNPLIANMAFQAVFGLYAQANGIEPQLINAEGTPGSTGVKPFADRREMMAAQRDPRYNTSEVYRQEVYRRAMASNF
jgi:hypothetical protein